MRRLFAIALICSAGYGVGCRALFDRQQTVSPTGQTNTTYTVKPEVTNGLDKASAAALQAPAPWGPVAAGVLGLTSAVLALIAKLKSDKAALVPALIVGVENAPQNDTVKRSIAQIATATGLNDRLDVEVQKLTK